MTDGIIQQVFKTFIKNGTMDAEIGDINLQVISVEVIRDLQQELIEKIEQSRSFYTIKGSGMDVEITECRLLEQLIGDNKE